MQFSEKKIGLYKDFCLNLLGNRFLNLLSILFSLSNLILFYSNLAFFSFHVIFSHLLQGVVTNHEHKLQVFQACESHLPRLEGIAFYI